MQIMKSILVLTSWIICLSVGSSYAAGFKTGGAKTIGSQGWIEFDRLDARNESVFKNNWEYFDLVFENYPEAKAHANFIKKSVKEFGHRFDLVTTFNAQTERWELEVHAQDPKITRNEVESYFQLFSESSYQGVPYRFVISNDAYFTKNTASQDQLHEGSAPGTLSFFVDVEEDDEADEDEKSGPHLRSSKKRKALGEGSKFLRKLDQLYPLIPPKGTVELGDVNANEASDSEDDVLVMSLVKEKEKRERQAKAPCMTLADLQNEYPEIKKEQKTKRLKVEKKPLLPQNEPIDGEGEVQKRAFKPARKIGAPRQNGNFIRRHRYSR